MLKIKLNIINKLGLHARASAKFVALASRFASEIEVQKGAHKVNGKSIMGVMMLAAAQGSEIELFIDGEDEHQLGAEMTTLIENRFGEAE
jgi:phosphocarrier protein HPr